MRRRRGWGIVLAAVLCAAAVGAANAAAGDVHAPVSSANIERSVETMARLLDAVRAQTDRMQGQFAADSPEMQMWLKQAASLQDQMDQVLTPWLQQIEAAQAAGERLGWSADRPEMVELARQHAVAARYLQYLTPARQTELLGTRTLDLGGGATMKLAPIPAGEFTMGSPTNEVGRYRNDDSESPQHRVRITKPFYMGATEVTQRQYEAVMGTNPSHYKGPDRPVEDVTYVDAVEFCRRLNEKAGTAVRLPTEAEWEYACRAGTTTAYYYGADPKQLSDYAWYDDDSGGQTHPVGLKKPNAWGLYDMAGNVSEWCQDWYDPGYYAVSPPEDPQGPPTGKASRVARGGTADDPARSCRSAGRDYGDQKFIGAPDHGFRVVVGIVP